MELIIGPKTEYLLNASLESLHAESREWLSEIDFWGEEMSCFHELLHKSGLQAPFPTKGLAEIEKELIRLTSENIAQTKKYVEAHERFLVSVMRGTSLSDEAEYRHKHRELLIAFLSLQGQI